MALPIFILAVALLSAGVVTYGALPAWAQFSHGLAFIVFSRRFEGMLIAISLIACIGLVLLIMNGRRRTWWLIGLIPVLTLFVHRFSPTRAHEFGLAVEDPAFVPAAQATALQPDDWVVGIRLGDACYAYPYSELFKAPVIVQADRTERIVLMWSAYANRALAMKASLEVRAADIDIVSIPANSTLIYNGRTGQFINCLTGQTISGRSPSGLGSEIPVAKMTWKNWLSAHPQTLVMNLRPTGPSHPIAPAWPMPGSADKANNVKVALVGTQQPVAVSQDAIGATPIDAVADGQPIMLFRPSLSLPIRALVRRVADLRPRFRLCPAGGDSRHGRSARRKVPGMFVDADTGSTWSTDGIWLSGPAQFRGGKLASMPVDDGLDYRVMKYWYPGLTLIDVPPPAANALAAGE